MATNPPKNGRNYQHGFTLIEMAVVVVIIGILMAAGLKVAGVQRDAAAYSATRTKQEAIKQALINYLRNNRRLPCPDSRVGWGNDGAVFAIGSAPDGIENRAIATGATTQPDTSQNCEARFGVLPWATLGLTRDAALDGFGNFYTYHIKAAGAATPDDWNITASFNSGLQGGIIRLERVNGALNPNFPAIPLPPSYVSSVVAVVSHSKNGLGARTVKGTLNAAPVVATDEAENANGEVDLNGDGVLDAVYITRDINNDPAAAGGAFDDIVMTLTPNDLLGALLTEQSLRSSSAQVAEANQAIAQINNAIVGFVIQNFRLPRASSDGAGACGAINNNGTEDAACYAGNIPWATLGVPPLDPWGMPYKYRVTQALADLVATGNPAADKAAFQAASGDRIVIDAAGNPLTMLAPFVVYSLGSNNQNNKCPNQLANPGADTYPAAPPNCHGSNENNAKTGATVGFAFVKAAVTIPSIGDLANTYYDDALDYVPKGSIDAKLP